MRLGEKEPAVVAGNVGQSSTSMSQLQNVPEVRLAYSSRSDARARTVLTHSRIQQ